MSLSREDLEVLAYYVMFSGPFYVVIGIPVSIALFIRAKSIFIRVALAISPFLYFWIYVKIIDAWHHS